MTTEADKIFKAAGEFKPPYSIGTSTALTDPDTPKVTEADKIFAAAEVFRGAYGQPKTQADEVFSNVPKYVEPPKKKVGLNLSQLTGGKYTDLEELTTAEVRRRANLPSDADENDKYTKELMDTADKRIQEDKHKGGFMEGVGKFFRGESVLGNEWYSARELFNDDGSVREEFQDPVAFATAVDGLSIPRNEKVSMITQAYASSDPYDTGKDPALIAAYLEMSALTRAGISTNTDTGLLEDTVSSVYNVVDNMAFNLFSAGTQKLNNEYRKEMYNRNGKNYLVPDNKDTKLIMGTLGKAKAFRDDFEVTMGDGISISIDPDDTAETLNDKIHEARVDDMTAKMQLVADSGVGSLIGSVMTMRAPIAIAKAALNIGGATLNTLKIANSAATAMKAAATSTGAAAVAAKGMADALMIGGVAGYAGGYEGHKETGAMIGMALGGTLSGTISTVVNRGAIKRGAAQILSQTLPQKWGITQGLSATAMNNLGTHIQNATPYDQLSKYTKSRVTPESYQKMLDEQAQAGALESYMAAKFGDAWNTGKNDPNTLIHFLDQVSEDAAMRGKLDEFILNTTGGQHTVVSYTNKKALVETLIDHHQRTMPSMQEREIMDQVARRLTKYEDILDNTPELLARVKADGQDNQVYRLVHDLIAGHSDSQKYQLVARDILTTPPATMLKNVSKAMHTVYSQGEGVTTHLRNMQTKGISSENISSKAFEKVEEGIAKTMNEWSNHSKKVLKGVDALHQSGPPNSDLAFLASETNRILTQVSATKIPHPAEVDTLLITAKRVLQQHAGVRDQRFQAAANIVQGLNSMSDTANKQLNVMRTFGRDMFATRLLQDVGTNSNISVSTQPKLFRAPKEAWHTNRLETVRRGNVPRDTFVDELNQLSKRSQATNTKLADDIINGVEIDLANHPSTSNRVRALVTSHNNEIARARRVQDVVADADMAPASKYATLMRLSAQAETHSSRQAILKTAMNYVDIVSHDVSALTVPALDKVRILRAIHEEPIGGVMRALKGTGTPEELADLLNYKMFYNGLFKMQEALGDELVGQYGKLYTQRFGKDLNIAEFLSHFVTKRSGFDEEKAILRALQTNSPELTYGGIYGTSIAREAAQKLKTKNLSGTWASMLGYDAFQTRFSQDSGLSASEALTAKNIAHKRAKTLTTEFVTEAIQDLRSNIHDIVSNLRVKELWKITKGVKGFEQRFNTHVFTAAGEVELTPVGKLIRGFVSDEKAYDDYVRLYNSAHDDTARLHLKSWMAANNVDNIKEIDELSAYFTNYFHAAGTPYSRKDWSDLHRALAWEAKVDAAKLNIVNAELRRSNQLFRDKGYQLEEIPHRQFRTSNKLAASDSFLAESTSMESIEARMFHRSKTSSDLAQQAKTDLLSVHDVMDPIEGILVDARDLIRYGTTAHASRMLDDLGVLVGSFGYKSSQAWLSKEAGTALGMYQQSIYNNLKYAAQKSNRFASTIFNVTDAAMNPFAALASIRSIFYTTLQAGITSAGTTGIHNGNIAKAMYTTAKRAVWYPLKTFGRIAKVMEYDIDGLSKSYRGLMNSPSANLTMEQIARKNVEKIIRESGDAPVKQHLQSLLVASAGSRRVGRGEELSMKALRGSEEYVGAPLFRALKERTERLVSRATLDEGTKVYAQLRNLVGQNRLADAEDLIISMSPNLRKADAYSMIKTVGTHLAAGTEETGMHRFLTNYHDAQVGRFGFHVAPSHIKSIARYLPGASQFYASKMLAFTRLAQNAIGGVKGLAGKDITGQGHNASMLYAVLAMSGLSYATSAIGNGTSLLGDDPDYKAGVIPGFDRANPLPSLVTDTMKYALGDEKNAMPSMGIGELVNMVLLGQPTTRVSGNMLVDMSTSAKLEMAQSMLEQISTWSSEAVSNTPMDEARYNLGFRTRFSKTWNEYNNASTEEQKLKSGEKLLKEYDKYKDSLGSRAIDSVLNANPIVSVFKGIIEDPFTTYMIMQELDEESIYATQQLYEEGGKAGQGTHIPVKGALENGLMGDVLEGIFNNQVGRQFYDSVLRGFFGTPDQDLFVRYDAIVNRLSEMKAISETEKQSYRSRFKEYSKKISEYDREREDDIERMVNDSYTDKKKLEEN